MWKNTYALLSETTADVRHMHTGECSMVHNRKSRVDSVVKAEGRGVIGGDTHRQ